MKARALICISVVGLLLVAWYCWRKSAIVGYWQSFDGHIIEFRDDGTFVSDVITGHYDYRPIGNENLKIENARPSIRTQTSTVSINIKSDVMTLTQIGLTQQLHRIDTSKTNVLTPEDEIKQHMNRTFSPPTNWLKNTKP